MSLTTPTDIPLLITVPAQTTTTAASAASKPLISSERRITPTWSLATLKTKLEPITGIPSAYQVLRTRGLDGGWIGINSDGYGGRDEGVSVGGEGVVWREGIRRGGEIEVTDTRPPALQPNYTSLTPDVPKYTMPTTQYSQLSDSVLAWKKSQKLGRFDPSAKSADELALERFEKDQKVIDERGITVGMRARVAGDDGRRGEVKFVGEVSGLGGERERGCVWVGVELDEPVGRNDGSVEVEVRSEVEGEGEGTKVKKEKKRLWEGKGEKFGVLVRPEKVEVGEEWRVVDDLMDEDMEEI